MKSEFLQSRNSHSASQQIGGAGAPCCHPGPSVVVVASSKGESLGRRSPAAACHSSTLAGVKGPFDAENRMEIHHPKRVHVYRVYEGYRHDEGNCRPESDFLTTIELLSDDLDRLYELGLIERLVTCFH
ncbi:uncharacterized protein K441DRAFT_138001 [Cenococcum geophilum 1.58]|uniref:uncharacterized protein n=1 Tax=Cenococcum geophilum 1.58 TaxID=794803 RepID=UPI00358FCC59|nr:hypothetical protein K441DRAFT_138001 [Cenococcum geophilum 1.58]